MLTVNYDPHYGAFFATHTSQWTLHVSDELTADTPDRTELRPTTLPAGAVRHVMSVKR